MARSQVTALAAEVGVRFLTLGFDPTSAPEDVPIMPKNRYDIMRAYMPTKGTLGLDMMLRSCTIQVRRDRALRSAHLPVSLIGSPINFANRLIRSSITSQSTGGASGLSVQSGGP